VNGQEGITRLFQGVVSNDILRYRPECGCLVNDHPIHHSINVQSQQKLFHRRVDKILLVAHAQTVFGFVQPGVLSVWTIEKIQGKSATCIPLSFPLLPVSIIFWPPLLSPLGWTLLDDGQPRERGLPDQWRSIPGNLVCSIGDALLALLEGGLLRVGSDPFGDLVPHPFAAGVGHDDLVWLESGLVETICFRRQLGGGCLGWQTRR
jgi:hypothetical protein